MNERENPGDRLARQNGLTDPAQREARKEAVLGVIERERAFVRRLGWIAAIAWVGALLILPAAAALGSMAQVAALHSGEMEAGFAYLMPAMLLGVLGSLSLVIAILTTVGWLWRSRTASLAMLEARLEELEAELRRRG